MRHFPRSVMFFEGAKVGGYEIVSRLRSGGMATLYLAKREGAAGFVRPVALKVIHPHLAEDPDFVRMFVEEAELSSKIHDPHVVHIEELGHAGAGLFLAMEYVQGASLAQFLAALSQEHRALTAPVAVHIAAEMALGLHAAHEAPDDRGQPLGIVHRDVSPHNVLLSSRGHVKVIDFGIAKSRDRSHGTASGVVKGKLSYMPPEQARGKPIDRRADVYALGIVLWEMLTMTRLFEAEAEVLLFQKILDPVVRPPSQVARVPIPPALDAVVLAALSVDPLSRPTTALEFRSRLLAAVPEAVHVTANDVAALLEGVLTEELAEQRGLLAGMSTAGTSKTDESPRIRIDEVLRTRTEKISSPHFDLTPSAVPVDTRAIVAAEVSPPPERESPAKVLWVALVAFALTLGIAAVVIGISMIRARRDPDEPRLAATLAPPAIAPESGSPVESAPAPPAPSPSPSVETKAAPAKTPKVDKPKVDKPKKTCVKIVGGVPLATPCD